jgi:hypothetical protein
VIANTNEDCYVACSRITKGKGRCAALAATAMSTEDQCIAFNTTIHCTSCSPSFGNGLPALDKLSDSEAKCYASDGNTVSCRNSRYGSQRLCPCVDGFVSQRWPRS